MAASLVRARVGAVAIALTALAARDASAYTVESAITDGCHESITSAALRSARASGRGLPLAYSDADDAALVDDVEFRPADDMKDIGAIALLLGVRDNDVTDLAATSLEELAQVTADPSTQRDHCLRSSDETEPDGTARAIADCRAFIKSKLMAALDGLGADGAPDVNARDDLRVTLALRGRTTVRLPRFYLRAGAALHALQDGFTHTFRRADDPHVVTVALDWIKYADGSLYEPIDGPPHLKELDRCDDPDALRAERHRLAIEASSAALAIGLDPTLSVDAKSAAFDRVLDTYLTYDGSGHCTADNQWCNAPENQYRPSGCACGDRPGHASGYGALGIAALVAACVARRRRRARTFAAIAAITTAGSASADGASAPAAPSPPAEHGPMTALAGESRAATPGVKDPAGSFFGHVAVGASYDHAALNATAGVKYQASRSWMVGLDVEWNPWIPTEPLGFRAGAGNAYGSLVRRFQMASESMNVRSTAALGASMLLIDLPGARKWSLGPLLGISFIGVEWKMAPGYFLVIDPTYLVFAVPHLTGIPLGYYQYRFQVGIEFGG